jgi:hypothetical protein
MTKRATKKYPSVRVPMPSIRPGFYFVIYQGKCHGKTRYLAYYRGANCTGFASSYSFDECKKRAEAKIRSLRDKGDKSLMLARASMKSTNGLIRWLSKRGVDVKAISGSPLGGLLMPGVVAVVNKEGSAQSLLAALGKLLVVWKTEASPKRRPVIISYLDALHGMMPRPAFEDIFRATNFPVRIMTPEEITDSVWGANDAQERQP